MPNVVIHRPGKVSDYTCHNPEIGEDQAMLLWSFTATVDGMTGLIDAIFPIGTGEAAAASHLHAELQANPSHLGGVTSTGPGGGSSAAGSETSSNTDGGGKGRNPKCIPKMKTYDGT